MELKRQALLVLAIANVIFTLGFGIIIPVLPYYSRNLGADAFMLGLLMASFSLMQFIFAPYWGQLSDRIGRKPVLAVGLIGFGLSFIIFGLASSLWMLFLSRIVGGILSAGIFPASFALIADVVEPGERGKIMGWMGAASGIGIIFGPAVCGIFVPFGISMPFFVAGALALVTVAALYFVMPESRAVTIDMHKTRASLLSTFGTVWTSLKTPLGIFFLLSMGICFALSVYEGTYSYFIMDKFGLTENSSTISVLNGTMQSTGPTVMAVLFTIMGVVGVLCQGMLVGVTIKRLGEEKTTIVGLLLAAVGLVMVLISPELVMMIISACVIGIGSGLVYPSISSLVSRRTNSEQQGSTLGVLGSYNSLGRIVGPPAGGWVYDMNLYMPYISSAILLVMGAIAVIFISRGKKREEDKARILIRRPS